MTYVYQVTVIGIAINNWQDLRNVIFSDHQPVEETYGGQVGTFTFDAPQEPVYVGHLIKVELLLK